MHNLVGTLLDKNLAYLDDAEVTQEEIDRLLAECKTEKGLNTKIKSVRGLIGTPYDTKGSCPRQLVVAEKALEKLKKSANWKTKVNFQCLDPRNLHSHCRSAI